MDSYLNKIKSLEKAKQDCDAVKAFGGSVVFTNGCFDILHPGHTRYLYDARKLGNYLVVAVNSDRSVKMIKDPGRPILTEQVRAELVASLACVDAVIIFDEDDPLRVIHFLLPAVLVKGGDWTEEEIIGADVVRAAGGDVRRIPFVTGFSTSSIIDEILGRYS